MKHIKIKMLCAGEEQGGRGRGSDGVPNKRWFKMLLDIHSLLQ